MKETKNRSEKIDEAQRKWDLMHTFSYSYICQPPRAYWDDEAFMADRETLLVQVASDVHRTDWKRIYAMFGASLPIKLAFHDAKEYYEASLRGETTPAYELKRGYMERMDKEREQKRKEK